MRELDLVHVEHLGGLLGVGERVPIQHFIGELRTRFGPSGGIAHLAGVVTYDEHCRVPQGLELGEFPKHHGVTQVDVGRGGIDPQLDAKRASLGPSARQLPKQFAFGQNVHASEEEFLVFLAYVSRDVHGPVLAFHLPPPGREHITGATGWCNI